MFFQKTLQDYAKNFFVLNGEWDKKRKQKGRAISERVISLRAGVVRNHIIPLWGNFAPEKLTAKIIDEKLCMLKLGGNQKNSILVCLSEIYKWLIMNDLTKDNPVKNVMRFSKNPIRHRGALTDVELGKLFPNNHAELLKIWGSQVYATAFLVLRDTGLRPGELRALQWKDWHSESKFFPITKAIAAGKRMEIKSTKTGAVKPAIVSEFTAAEIGNLYIESKNLMPDSFIFLSSAGLPLCGNKLRKKLKRACKIAGIDRPEISPYWLRYTFNTRMLELLPDDKVRKLMGHATPLMTRYYRDADIFSLKREAEEISKILPKNIFSFESKSNQLSLCF
ncbi:DNA breaking-rejoining enzymes super family [Candidatus Termititenax aidoneus]|uniref:DNA breaking-rejoining enzymes super family n=1 Tax=Termititenax aidoneus TaxID=2218524 RepID=A0A388TE06_TERA1|nr:DNA breaking-rejoining enzymes super family [Candidatus Termititenax aidoneus]